MTTVVVQRLDEAVDRLGRAGDGGGRRPRSRNAFFDATGVRLTSTPMNPARVRAALAAAKA